MSKITVQLLISFAVLSLGFILSSSDIFAARSLIIESYKQIFTNDEEGEIKVTPDGFTDEETIFIKGAFSFSGSTNYFGFTKKGDSWIKNSISASDQLSVKLGEWDRKLSVKPDLSDTGFRGSDNYNLKVGFYYYTTGGNLSSINWSDVKSVNISYNPSPTSIPSLTPTLTPFPTVIPSSAATSVPVKTPTDKPNPSITSKTQVTPTIYISSSSKTEKITPSKTPVITQSLVLGEFTKPTLTDFPSPTNAQTQKNSKFLPILGLFLGGGLLLISFSFLLGIKQFKRSPKS